MYTYPSFAQTDMGEAKKGGHAGVPAPREIMNDPLPFWMVQGVGAMLLLERMGVEGRWVPLGEILTARGGRELVICVLPAGESKRTERERE